MGTAESSETERYSPSVSVEKGKTEMKSLRAGVAWAANDFVSLSEILVGVTLPEKKEMMDLFGSS